MRTVEERLQHDVEIAIAAEIVKRLRVGNVNTAKVLADCRYLPETIIQELCIRWTIIERPRKQTTLRQES